MRDSYETPRKLATRDPPNAYRTRIDLESDDLLQEILGVIAVVEDVPVTELPELYEILDPDALEALLCSARVPLSVTFRYSDSRVKLTRSGTVTVEPLPD